MELERQAADSSTGSSQMQDTASVVMNLDILDTTIASYNYDK